MSTESHDATLNGLTHRCGDPECHVRGFVTTSMKLREVEAPQQVPFIGSGALLDALLNTYVEHIAIPETDGPDGPYVGCLCGWRSDDLSNSNPGLSYAIHLTNAQHAAAVVALRPLVARITPPPANAEATR